MPHLKILNIRNSSDIRKAISLKKKIAYCGNNYDWWCNRYMLLKYADDYSYFGKPKALIVRGDRDLTCSNYYDYFKRVLMDTAKLTSSADEHNSVYDRTYAKMKELMHYDYLLCWCAPQRCHVAEIIKIMHECNLQ